MSLSATPMAMRAIHEQSAELRLSGPVIVVFPGSSRADLKRGRDGQVVWHREPVDAWCVMVLGALEFEQVRDAVKVAGDIEGIPATVLCRAIPPTLEITVEGGKLHVTAIGA